MFLFSPTKYLCLCGDVLTDPLTKLPRAMHVRNLFRLADLYMCPNCVTLKCPNCCTVGVECKYCPNCMTDYTDQPGITRCTKNCFECPKCDSPLAVTVHNSAVDGVAGKQFVFSCVHCSYSYETRVVTKPASLTTILKREDPSAFFELMEKYTLANKLEGLTRKSAAPRQTRLTPALVSRMKAMDIQHVDTEALGEIDTLRLKLAEVQPRSLDLTSGPLEKINLPSGKHLAAKRKYSCNECNHVLLLPVADPRLMKHLQKELAPDIVPFVGAKVKRQTAPRFVPGTDTACVLSFVNPLPNSINVNVSILGNIPPEFGAGVSVSLPITHFTIQARREKLNTVDAIPSIYLTNTTKAARAEQLVRAVRREAQRKQTNSEDPVPFVEHGSNWASVPFSVSVDESSTSEQPRIPFYITVETRRPDNWPASSKRGLKFGFWVICDIE